MDDPSRPDFFFSAVHRSGDAIVSVSTKGRRPRSPRRFARIRDLLHQNLGEIAQRLIVERHRSDATGASTSAVDCWPLMPELFSVEPTEGCPVRALMA